MLNIEPRDSGGGAGNTLDDMVLILIADIEAQLPHLLDVHDAGSTTFLTRHVLGVEVMDSLATVLSQEITKFNRLITIMRESLIDLRKAIGGLILMSVELDNTYVAFTNNQVGLRQLECVCDSKAI